MKSGIYLEHLSFNHYEVDGLYIKLDKKLTLKAHTIIIPKVKKKPSFDAIDKVLDRIKYLLTFFHYIELEKIDFKDNHYKLVYADNILYITSDDYEIAGNVWRKGHILVADISLFYLKKEHINMVAKLNYDLYSDKLILEGIYDAYRIKGRFKVIKEGEEVEFILNSEAFSDLKRVINRFSMPKSVTLWITQKIQAKQYRLYALSGRGTVHGSQFHLDFHSLHGSALLQDVKIYYREGLSPVKSKKVMLRYAEDKLFFDLTDPTYENRPIDVAVSIENIGIDMHTKLYLDMFFNTKLDEVVQKILASYKIEIPILHKKSNSKVSVKLAIPLQKRATDKIDIAVKAHLGKGILSIKALKLPVEGGDVSYSDHRVVLKNIKLKNQWYEGVVNGKIYPQKKQADITFSASKITIGKKREKIFNLHKKEIPLRIKYGKSLSVTLPSYKIKLDQEKGATHISIGDISKIKPFLKNFYIEYNGGKMDLWTKDFTHYTFKGELIRHACFIYSDKVCYMKIPCRGSFGEEGVEFYAFGKRLYYSTKKSLIHLNALNIDLEKFLASKTYMEQGKKQIKQSGKLVIKGKRSKLRYDKYTLHTESYKATIYLASGRVKAKGKLGSDSVTFNKKGTHIAIEALRIHDQMLHPLINFNGLQQGRYTIRISGIPGKLMRGEILLEGGILKSFKAYSKTRTFIKNDKKLSQLQDLGFGISGFKIKEGKITYHILKEKVIFDSIYIKGDIATIVGKGTLDMRTKKLNINLGIQTVRKLGKIVGSLPLIGYILMGEDNSITFGLKIKGTLANPKVETSAAKELLMLPFDLIKRTLQSPAHIINSEKKQKRDGVKPTAVEEITLPRNRVAP